MKKILPIYIDPPMNTFNSLGSWLSMNLKNHDALPWYASSFIQLSYHTGLNLLLLTDAIFTTSPWIKTHKISKDLIDVFCNDIISFVQTCINSDCYLFFNIDQYYFPASHNYMNRHREHDVFIYGFDTEKSCFFVTDNLKWGKYTYAEFPFSEFRKAYYSDTRGNLEINLFMNESNQYEFDINYVIHAISDYVNSRNNIGRSDPYAFQMNKDHIYGISVYQAVMEEVKSQKIDIRKFHLLWEHKKCMMDRIHYLIENTYLKKKDILSTYSEIEKRALVLRTLALKFRVSKKHNILENITAALSEIANQEKEILSELVSQLSK